MNGVQKLLQQAKVIALDFDGVIVESVGIKDDAFSMLFKSYPDHHEQIMEYHLAHNATVRYQKFKHIFQNILKLPYNKEVEQTLSDRFSELVFERIVSCPLVPGVVEFLDKMTGVITLYLVSMTPEMELLNILKKRDLFKYFKKIYSSSWKKSEALSDICHIESIYSQDLLFIGDSPEDYYSASEANAKFVGRNSGKRFPDSIIPLINNFINC